MIVLLIISLLLIEIIIQLKKKKKNTMRDFPGGPVTKNPNTQSGGAWV